MGSLEQISAKYTRDHRDLLDRVHVPWMEISIRARLENSEGERAGKN